MKKLRKFILALLAAITLASPMSEVASNNVTNKVSAARKGKTLKLTKKQKQLAKDIRANGTITKNGKTTTFTISDDAFEAVLIKDKIIKAPKDQFYRSHAGKTTIRCHGSLWHGNFDIYLSKAMLNRIRGVKASLGCQYVYVLLTAAVGPLGTLAAIANTVIKVMVAKVVRGANHYKAGRVYKVRGWRYKSWRYQ